MVHHRFAFERMNTPYAFTAAFAAQADAADPLRSFRSEFLIPPFNGGKALYFTGNSLGLQPKEAKTYLLEELNAWETLGVEGHMEGKRPWMRYHEFFAEPMARLADALPEEVVVMNGLTANLHFLMISFYRPTPQRYKIICEAKAFPSDLYALASQVEFHGLQPETALIRLEPRPGEETLRTEDVLDAIAQAGPALALVMMGGVNYYTGQVMDMPRITAAAHAVGALAGWDLAHAAGNIPLHLHVWNVDFAAWCSYKYLNAGPGATAVAFVHQGHHKADLPRLAGWWGHNKSTRFLMPPTFEPMQTAEAWQLSNAPVMSMAPLLASLDCFDRAGMEALRAKSVQLSGYLQWVMEVVAERVGADFKLITPSDWSERGCQISMHTGHYGKALYHALQAKGVVADWREPAVIRLAPVPLYNSFDDVYRFGMVLEEVLLKLNQNTVS
jgi:kynureninase